MGKRTPLYDEHLNAGAKMVDFSGWDMPVNYGSQIDEHNIVRNDAGMFDVSHMTIVDVFGPGSHDFLLRLLANNVDKLKNVGDALYTCMLNELGGCIDDLIVYRYTEDSYRLVVNCATREVDMAWFQKQANEYAIEIAERQGLAMIAIQGPNARKKAMKAMTKKRAQAANKLKQPFTAIESDNWYIARTGYTREDGFEIILPAAEAKDFWTALLAQKIKPCGLGARDTLRLEAGFNLAGIDMDESVTPLESNLAWTVAWEPEHRDFIGRVVLAKKKAEGVKSKLRGLVLSERGVLRSHQKVVCNGKGDGEITSGGFSPTLQKGIALARIPVDVEVGDECKIEVRDKLLSAKVVKPPFIKDGKANFDLID